MEDVHVTPDLVYRYQLKDQVLKDVLQADLKALENMNQPFLVNDQLSQLYLDMELEGLSTKLKLEEGSTSSSGSSGEELQSSTRDNISRFKVNIEFAKIINLRCNIETKWLVSNASSYTVFTCVFFAFT